MDDNKTEVLSIDINHACNIFGHNDVHMKTIEKELGVDIFSQNGDMVVRGKESAVNNARKVLDTLQELSKRGNEILEQNVNYAVEMAASSEDTEKLIDIDKEIIDPGHAVPEHVRASYPMRSAMASRIGCVHARWNIQASCCMSKRMMSGSRKWRR